MVAGAAEVAEADQLGAGRPCWMLGVRLRLLQQSIDFLSAQQVCIYSVTDFLGALEV